MLWGYSQWESGWIQYVANICHLSCRLRREEFLVINHQIPCPTRKETQCMVERYDILTSMGKIPKDHICYSEFEALYWCWHCPTTGNKWRTHKAEARQLVHIALRLISTEIQRRRIHEVTAYQTQPPPLGPPPFRGKRKSKKRRYSLEEKRRSFVQVPIPWFGRIRENHSPIMKLVADGASGLDPLEVKTMKHPRRRERRQEQGVQKGLGACRNGPLQDILHV